MMKFSFQDKEAETVKKPKFISPYQRYKCVIPMLVKLEAQEREMQQKREDEKRLEEAVKDVSVDQAEIDESKNRVHQHFKQVAQSSNEVIQNTPKKNKKKKKKKKNPEVILDQMHGKKRKRESNIAKESIEQEKSNNDFCTPAPSLDPAIMRLPKKMRQEMLNKIEERGVQKTLAQIQTYNNTQHNKPIR